MSDNQRRLPSLFRDDGHPEARDCDSNYVVLDPQPPRNLLQRLFGIGPQSRRREARPPQALRIEPPTAATPA